MNLEQIREQLLQQITVVQQQPLPLLLAVAGCFLTVRRIKCKNVKSILHQSVWCSQFN